MNVNPNTILAGGATLAGLYYYSSLRSKKNEMKAISDGLNNNLSHNWKLFTNVTKKSDQSFDSRTFEEEVVCFLDKYEIGYNNGFLGDMEPLQRLNTSLDPSFEQYEKLMDDLPVLLQLKQFRNVVKTMPQLNWKVVENDKRSVWRIMLIFAFCTNAYVFEDNAHPEKVLPKNIAVPYWKLCQKLDLPPIIIHRLLVLNNWAKVDPNGPCTVDNLKCITMFLGGLDESWFNMVTADVELSGAKALRAIARIQLLQKNKLQMNAIIKCMEDIKASIDDMCASMKRMKEQCDPHIFFNRYRPYVSGWKGNPNLPGIVYEGVSDKPKEYNGASAAQSTLIAALDCFLGVEHKHKNNEEFLKSMRTFMPIKAREFLTYLEAHCVRPFCTKHSSNQELVNVYNACIKSLSRFRKIHMGIVSRYVLQQLPEYKAKLKSGAIVEPNAAVEEENMMVEGVTGTGTGGTGIMDFLKPTLQDTSGKAIK